MVEQHIHKNETKTYENIKKGVNFEIILKVQSNISGHLETKSLFYR